MPGLTLSGVHFLTGQKGTKKAAPTGTSSLRLRRRTGRRTAKGPGKSQHKEESQQGRGNGFSCPTSSRVDDRAGMFAKDGARDSF
jgi:hypothetical protein